MNYVIARNPTDRFLLILEKIHDLKPDDFDRVLDLGGSRQRYFGTSKGAVASTGKSMAPRRIGTTGYWVMTNASTSMKEEILREVLSELEFHPRTLRGVPAALDGSA